MEPINFYTDRKFMPHESALHVHFLFPWWGEVVEDIYKGEKLYDNYLAKAAAWYKPVGQLGLAKFAVLPSNLKYYKKFDKIGLVREFVDLCRQSNKKLVIFFKDDSCEDIDLDDRFTVIFRTSFYKSRKKPNEFAMPVWSGDLVSRYGNGDFKPTLSLARINIGFCGQTLPPFSFTNRFWLSIKFRFNLRAHAQGFLSAELFGKRWFSFLRYFVLTILKREKSFTCDFLERTEYLGGAWIRKGVFDLEQYSKKRDEYIKNLISNDFFPCVRGGGNYSMRIYEVLCMGKIPIFVDTDCPLPYPELIDWPSHLIVVPSTKVESMPELIKTTIRHLDDDSFRHWQIRNRELWLNYLSPEGFFKNMIALVKQPDD